MIGKIFCLGAVDGAIMWRRRKESRCAKFQVDWFDRSKVMGDSVADRKVVGSSLGLDGS